MDILIALGGLVIGFIAAYVWRGQELALERRTWQERKISWEENKTTKEQIESTFKAIAGDVLRIHSKEFAEKAVTSEKSVEKLVDSMGKTLRDVEGKISDYEKQSKEQLGSLNAQIRHVLDVGSKMQDTALSLKSVLSSASGIRGRWGEAVLKNILEESGLTEGIDFTLQTTIAGEEEAKLRPDTIVNLPGGLHLAIDSKASLDAFFRAVEENDPEKKKEHIAKFVQDLRTHISKLSSKEYQAYIDPKVPYVVMFVPGEAAVRAAFEFDQTLYRDAQAKRIMLGSPATTIPLILLIANAWKQHKSVQNAEKIITEVSVLGARLKTFMGYVVSIGPALSAATKRFNEAAGSWDSRVQPEIERINELGGGLESIGGIKQVEEEPRIPVKMLEGGARKNSPQKIAKNELS